MEPTKTLKFLKDITGEEFEYDIECGSIKKGYTHIYDLEEKSARVKNDKITSSLDNVDGWISMSPKKFIDKMTKGEYTWD